MPRMGLHSLTTLPRQTFILLPAPSGKMLWCSLQGSTMNLPDCCGAFKSTYVVVVSKGQDIFQGANNCQSCVTTMASYQVHFRHLSYFSIRIANSISVCALHAEKYKCEYEKADTKRNAALLALRKCPYCCSPHLKNGVCHNHNDCIH